MKKFIITFLTSIILSYTLKAQIQMYDIYTPNGSPVTTWITGEMPFSVRQDLDAEYAITYPNAMQLETHIENNVSLSSTNTFNCHGYGYSNLNIT